MSPWENIKGLSIMHCVNLLNFFEYHIQKFWIFFWFPFTYVYKLRFCLYLVLLAREDKKVSICSLYRYSFFPPIALQLLICPNIRKERSNLVCFLDSIVLQKNFVRSLCWVTESLLNWSFGSFQETTYAQVLLAWPQCACRAGGEKAGKIWLDVG